MNQLKYVWNYLKVRYLDGKLRKINHVWNYLKAWHLSGELSNFKYVWNYLNVRYLDGKLSKKMQLECVLALSNKYCSKEMNLLSLHGKNNPFHSTVDFILCGFISQISGDIRIEAIERSAKLLKTSMLSPRVLANIVRYNALTDEPLVKKNTQMVLMEADPIYYSHYVVDEIILHIDVEGFDAVALIKRAFQSQRDETDYREAFKKLCQLAAKGNKKAADIINFCKKNKLPRKRPK